MNNHEFKIMLYDDSAYRIYGLYCTSFPMINIVYEEQEDTGNFNIPMSMYLFIMRVHMRLNTISDMMLTDLAKPIPTISFGRQALLQILII